MTQILPGQEFEITYGEGRQLTVKALTGKRQEEIAPLLKRTAEAEEAQDLVELVSAAKAVLMACVPEHAERLWAEEVSAADALTIGYAVWSGGRLDEEQEKN